MRRDDAPLLHGDSRLVPFMEVIALLALAAAEPDHRGNPQCWHNSDKSFEECCLRPANTDGFALKGEACWHGPWFTESFCCQPLPAVPEMCFEAWHGKGRRKRDDLLAALEFSSGRAAELMHSLAKHYERLLWYPLMMWYDVCKRPTSPMLWAAASCSCCDPPDERCEEGHDDEAMVPEYAHCCFPVFSRMQVEVPDPRLEASIQAHLGELLLHKSSVKLSAEGTKLQWHMDEHTSRGCIIEIGASIIPCEETHACPTFDCSYLRAFVMSLQVIHSQRELPDMQLVLNAADLTLHDAAPLPVFTRTGTVWAKFSLGLPFEWQLHPGQCQRHLVEWAMASLVSWEDRLPELIWRGSNSNCRFVNCNVSEVAEGHLEEAEHCAESPVRDCTWNSSTWLQMPRGRLVWLSRFHPSIDAKFVPSSTNPFSSDLEDFLISEGLLVEPMEVMLQARYKYVIAIEGDSAADRLYWQLFSRSVVLVPRGPWRVMSLFDMMEPYVHYVPLRFDLADLAETIDWLQENDAKAKEIASNGLAFAQRYLTCDGILRYVELLLRAYESRFVE